MKPAPTQKNRNGTFRRPSASLLAKLHARRREKGKIAVIEPASGEFFIATTVMLALRAAREKFPEAIFYVARIGYRTAQAHHGMLRPVGR